MWGWGTPLPPLSIYFLIFSPFTFSFLSLALPIFFFCPSLPFLPEVPLRFQAGGHRRRPNLGLVCFYCVICVICIRQLRWTVVFCSIWFSFVCSFSALSLLVGSFEPVPDMTYNVFGGTLSLTQSINQCYLVAVCWCFTVISLLETVFQCLVCLYTTLCSFRSVM